MLWHKPTICRSGHIMKMTPVFANVGVVKKKLERTKKMKGGRLPPMAPPLHLSECNFCQFGDVEQNIEA